MNELPKISVLLPIYNTNTEYLKECIESILNQTFEDFELIIIDDASDIDLDGIVNSYNDNRIRYYKNETNLGITKTRNKLLELAKGKYVAVADHDDISLPERLEKEYNFLESNPNISLVSGWIEAFDKNKDKKKIIKRRPYPKYIDFLKGCAVLHQACMWRKADFEKFDLKYEDGYFGAQDYALFSKAARYLDCANIKEVLLRYRQHSENASNQKREMSLEIDKVKEEILDFLTSDKKSRQILCDKFLIPKVSFIKNVFSVENRHSYKIIRILGFKIMTKRFRTDF